MNLRLDWCSHEAAKYACEHWHYSRKIPKSKLNKIGVWENNKFIGAVIYGVGSGNSTRGEKYGLAKTHEVAELQRVALTTHKTPTSKIVSVSIRMIRKANPNLQMLISFADEAEQNHHGGIYQATNWIYLGTVKGYGGFRIHGQSMHPRVVGLKGWKQSLPWLQQHIDPNASRIKALKHRYVYPLNNEVRQRVQPLAMPYPKRASEEGL